MLRSLAVLRSFPGMLNTNSNVSPVLYLVPCIMYHVSCCLYNGPSYSSFGYFFFSYFGHISYHTFCKSRWSPAGGQHIPNLVASLSLFWPALPLTANTASHVQIFRHSLFYQTRFNFAMAPKRNLCTACCPFFRLLSCSPAALF